jgi:hypothetical protein
MSQEEGKELSQLKTLRDELSSAKKKVLALQQEIREVEEQIYSKCKHEWKIDYTNVGEHTEHICTNCGGFRGGFCGGSAGVPPPNDGIR